MLEFEVKARVPPGGLEALRARLGAPERAERHVDAYFAHPARDFARTDEALRLRAVDGRAELTYKGPKLDAQTKTRRELTLRVADEATLRAMLDALGFRLVAEVRKRREIRHAAGFEVALDEVEGVGAYVELERALPEGADTARAKADAAALLAAWGLHETERRSYLELLLAGRSRG